MVEVGFKMFFILTGSQAVLGSVPTLKYSYLVGQPSQGSVPVRIQIGTLTKSGGIEMFEV